MTGLGAKPGPKPKPEEEKVGHPQKAYDSAAGTSVVESGWGERGIVWPAADPNWHDIARRWYDATKKSGTAILMEPSDVIHCMITAESLSYYLTSGKRSAQMLMAVTALLQESAGTIATRRRNNIEIHREEEKVASPGDLAKRAAREMAARPAA